jgi:hypothetical protein
VVNSATRRVSRDQTRGRPVRRVRGWRGLPHVSARPAETDLESARSLARRNVCRARAGACLAHSCCDRVACPGRASEGSEHPAFGRVWGVMVCSGLANKRRCGSVSHPTPGRRAPEWPLNLRTAAVRAWLQNRRGMLSWAPSAPPCSSPFVTAIDGEPMERQERAVWRQRNAPIHQKLLTPASYHRICPRQPFKTAIQDSHSRQPFKTAIQDSHCRRRAGGRSARHDQVLAFHPLGEENAAKWRSALLFTGATARRPCRPDCPAAAAGFCARFALPHDRCQSFSR